MATRKVVQVVAGGGHTVCVAEDGSVFAFGSNSRGQLGVGDKEERAVPTILRGELANKSVLQVAAGARHTISVTADGLVYACGNNGAGELGMGYGWMGGCSVPTQHSGQLQLKNAVYVAAACKHTLCITENGTLFAWGDNEFGQLGVGEPAKLRGTPDHWRWFRFSEQALIKWQQKRMREAKEAAQGEGAVAVHRRPGPAHKDFNCYFPRAAEYSGARWVERQWEIQQGAMAKQAKESHDQGHAEQGSSRPRRARARPRPRRAMARPPTRARARPRPRRAMAMAPTAPTGGLVDERTTNERSGGRASKTIS